MTERTKLISGIERSFKAYPDKYTLPFIAAAEHPRNIPSCFLKIAGKRSEKGNLKFRNRKCDAERNQENSHFRKTLNCS